MRTIRWTTAAGILVALAGCAEPTGPPTHLDVDVEVGSDIVRQGEPVAVTVTVTNRGAETVAIYHSGCDAQFLVLAANGEVVFPGHRPCITIGPAREELAPGERYVFEESWRGEADSSPILLPPGEYRLQGRVFGENAQILGPVVRVRLEGGAASDA